MGTKKKAKTAPKSKGKKGGVKSPGTASGEILLRIPKSLHQALLSESEREGISLNQLCLAKLSVQLHGMVSGSGDGAEQTAAEPEREKLSELYMAELDKIVRASKDAVASFKENTLKVLKTIAEKRENARKR